MFTDRAKIFVQGGAGGSGAVSFRREAHVPKGGPDGGDGGRGADVVLVCDGSLRDLQAFRRRAHFKGARGGHGEGGERHGASPAVLEIAVPPGTVVEDADGGDALRPDPSRASAPSSPRAARADAATSASRTRRGRRRASPRRACRARSAGSSCGSSCSPTSAWSGLPNAGKSSLLARLTRAAPKVADYPFTTLEPVLGTLEGPERQLVVADIPGLIEGASGGAGLGHEFLAHVERTGLLVHVLDLAPLDGSDPVANHATVEAELAGYGHGLAELPRMLALSKADLVPAEDAARAAAEWRERLPDAAGGRRHVGGHGGGARRAEPRALAPRARAPGRAGARRGRTIAEHKVYRPADDDGLPRRARARTASCAWSGRRSSGCSRGTTSRTRRRSATSRSGCARWA